MKIKDIIIETADMLGLVSERALVESVSEANESEILDKEEVKSLFNLCKFSIQELCSNYTPMLVTKDIEITNKKYPLSNLDNYIRMQELSRDGVEVDYKIINRNINVEENGSYTIQYFSYPEIESLFDEIDFLDNFSPDVLIFGLCSYYCLSKGMFDDFNEFHDKYVERAESLKAVKLFHMPARRWE